MEITSICRICLSTDVKIHVLVNTKLQGIYEELTLMPVETNDARPLQVCYICCARLQNYYKLRANCLQSEELFTQMLCSGVNQAKQVILHKKFNNKTIGIDHPVLKLSVDMEANDSANTQIFDFVEVKQEFDPEIPPDLQDGNNQYSFTNTEVHVEIIKQEIDDNIPDIESEPLEGHSIFSNRDDSFQSSIPDDNMEPSPITLETSEIQSTSSLHTKNKNTNLKKIKINPHTKLIPENGPNIDNHLFVEIVDGNHDRPYCSSCHIFFSHEASLKKHIKLHGLEKKFECDHCHKRFKQKSNLIGHMPMHTGIKKYKCKSCNKAYSHKGNLKTHICAHSDKKPYECDICKRTFRYSCSLRKHYRKHTGHKPYSCKLCEKTFYDSSALNSHQKYIHSKSTVKRFECNVCKKRVMTQYELKNHLLIHSGEKPHECQICKKRFRVKSDLIKHLKRQHYDIKPFQCKCGLRFVNGTELKNHELLHSGERPHKCQTCEKSFRIKSDLMRHAISHSDDKPHKCDQCEKYFKTIRQLKKHAVTHEKKDGDKKQPVKHEKKFQCEICKKGFTRKCYLEVHIRAHNGVKPFICEYCNKGFSAKGHLVIHTRIHTKEKPYKCNDCGKSFSRGHMIKKHACIKVDKSVSSSNSSPPTT